MNEITVVIPAYNSGRFIAETIQSVLVQTLPPSEIIVVDDCSTDATCEIVEQIAENSCISIQLIRSTSNSGGPATSLNHGITVAKTKYIALLDHDDLFLPSNLKEKRNAILQHPESEMVFADCQGLFQGELVESIHSIKNKLSKASETILKHNAPLIDIFNKHCTTIPSSQVIKTHAYIPGLMNGCSNMFFYKQLWEDVGGFDQKVSLAADYDFLFRAIRKPIVWLNKVLTYRRRHSQKATEQGVGAWLDCHAVALEQINQNNQNLLETDKQIISQQWEWLLHKRLNKAKSQRDWKTYKEIHSYLTKLSNTEKKINYKPKKLYPFFLYRAKDIFISTTHFAKRILRSQ